MIAVLQSVLTLYLLIDSIGAIPTVANLLKDYSTSSKIKVIVRESFFALCLLTVFAIGGSSILSFLGLSEAAMRISSGLLIGIIGIGMIFPKLSVMQGD